MICCSNTLYYNDACLYDQSGILIVGEDDTIEHKRRKLTITTTLIIAMHSHPRVIPLLIVKHFSQPDNIKEIYL